MLGGALISAVLGTRLPGPGTIYLSQTLQFLAPVRMGDQLRISVTVTARDEIRQRLTLACECVNQNGTTVITGEAEVVAPTERIERARTTLPEVIMTVGNDGLQRLLEYVRPLGSLCMPATLDGPLAFDNAVSIAVARTKGIVLGARVPIVLTSRADARDTRLASCAVAVLLAHHYQQTPI